jgi:hypothetical protein
LCDKLLLSLAKTLKNIGDVANRGESYQGSGEFVSEDRLKGEMLQP